MDCLKLTDENIRSISDSIPKAELHIHLEGSFEPELMCKIAERNGIKLKNTLEEIKQRFNFQNLGEFLDMYYEACSVLLTAEDFFDLTYEYIKKSHSQGLTYFELFFDPQTHLNRNVSMEIMFEGILRGLEAGRKEFNVESNLIPCFLRDLTEKEAIEVFNKLLTFKDKFIGIGLDSYEVGNPAQKFVNLYKLAKDNGLRVVAHAGEEGKAKDISDTIELLGVHRIDHGCAIIHDENLIKQFAESKTPLTMCPLSNKKLQVTPDLSNHMIKKLLDKGVRVMINSDDPSYFGGYIGDNYYETWKALNLTLTDIEALAKNSFLSTFLTDEQKAVHLNNVDHYLKKLNQTQK